MDGNELMQNKDFLSGSSVILQWSVAEWILILRYYLNKLFKIIVLFLFFVILFLFLWFFKGIFNPIIVLIGFTFIPFFLFFLFSYIIMVFVIFLLSFLSRKKDEIYLTDKGIWVVASLGAFILFLRLLEWKNSISEIANAINK